MLTIAEKPTAHQAPWYTCELCRNLHILGEDKENTVIRLADNSRGFEKGNKKPVISFNKSSIEGKETTNCEQMNTLEDITIDVTGGNVFYYDPKKEYQTALDIEKNGEKQRISMEACSDKIQGSDALNRDWGRLIGNVEIK